LIRPLLLSSGLDCGTRSPLHIPRHRLTSQKAADALGVHVLRLHAAVDCRIAEALLAFRHSHLFPTLHRALTIP